MSLGIGLGITSIHGLPIIGQGELSEFDASANAGLFVSAPRWPLLASAPATVVNGQRFRLAGTGFGTEYLGVGGAWVPQDDVTMWVWRSKKCAKFNGNTSQIYVVGPTWNNLATAEIEFGVLLNVDNETRWEKIVGTEYTNSTGAFKIGTQAFVPGSLHLEIVDGAACDKNNIFVNGFAVYRFVFTFITAQLTNIKIFRDGALVDEASRNFSAWSSVSAGVYFACGDNPFNDVMSHFKISGINGTLIWDAENIAGSSVPDSSGNGNDGTVVDVTPQFAWVPA